MRQGLDQHLTGLIVGDTTGADTAISNGNNGTTSTLTPTNDLAAAAIGAKNATAKPFLKIVYPTTQLPDRVHSLLVLDSSFNPPTKAHMGMMVQTITSLMSPSMPFDCCLLLLSTLNADKPPLLSTPATLPLVDTPHHHSTSNAATTPAYTSTLDRLEMMCSLVDIVPHNLPCHVALINQPNFVDKLAVIQKTWPTISTVYFVLGCDTLQRFFNKKYYLPDSTLESTESSKGTTTHINNTENGGSCVTVGNILAESFFDRGGRIICAGRQLKDAAKITDATTHILTQGSIISDALHSEALLPSCIDKIIELSRWTTDSSGSSVDRQASLYVHEKFKLDSISSSQVRDLFARYWSALANYGEGATPSAATQSQHTPDSHASSDSILSELSHLVDEAVISYILKHHLYKPA
ncbi:hypothetical protein BASA82_001141 [Batrachochytrium salamandrivorans]|uniref:Nicotinamide-nucleotide adenylyltransferase n=1 Tax=Batrachochytrium salamandrivorans TaxID=1357716 RepID=A0ABQ8FPK0_9FUNG|nr:hypothetical protein BASA62_007511 [Batrachochytrium salamandrivorans]KAH6569774.1 hypothetical protein BASA60_008110 [Batrachochytrium salamandrivorans]KAH6580452.1 hypothetical protein BASA61_009684 [Batrachochytrium salamandrivorans]KAH6601191.1 hypothetical protein BASA50_001716 [Batrachochytrium salamandrivorans]KAH9256887.1 hypothetical protein BASA81_005002 [Batrachochytrium salamandrivorans]